MDKIPILKALSLILAILFFLGFVSLQAFAAEEDMEYQDTGLVDGVDGDKPPPGGSPEGAPDSLDGDIPAEGWEVLMEDVSAIRRGTELFLYFVIPCFCAVWVVYKFCMWFCSTFIESVL